VICARALVELARLRDLLEQVDRGRATEPEGASADVGLEPFDALRSLERPKEEIDVRLRTELRRAQCLESREIEKEKFLWQREVLLEEPIAEEGTLHIGQHTLVLAESDRSQRIGRQLDHRSVRPRRIAEDDGRAAVGQQLIQRIRQLI